MSDSVRPHRRQPTRLPCPWDSPGKNTGMGCHCLLHCVKVKSLCRVRLVVTPWTAAYQALPSLGFSRQEHWSGLPVPSPMHESEKWKGSHSVVSDSSDPMDCSLPGFSIDGIFQARVLESGAIAFSDTLMRDLENYCDVIWYGISCSLKNFSHLSFANSSIKKVSE